MMVWNMGLTAVVGLMGFLLRSRFDELERISILLNRTREEVARDYIPRREVDDRVEKLVVYMDQRFNRIEQKLQVHEIVPNQHKSALVECFFVSWCVVH